MLTVHQDFVPVR